MEDEIMDLFAPVSLGKMHFQNRFVHSATYEAMATREGEVTDRLVKRYETLGRGELGCIIPGHMFVHPHGRGGALQIGIHCDEMIVGLRRLVEAAHRHGAKVAFQLAHGGGQTTEELAGTRPAGPSAWRNPVTMVKSRAMTEEDISEVIQAFAEAARRAVVAGVDAVQIHAAHGYLLSQFLSPVINQRTDIWGGSDEGRFLLLKEVLAATRNAVADGFPILVKMNGHDHTPREGLTPQLAAKYAAWLAKDGVDGIEVSCGATTYAFMNMIRGEVPVKEIVSALRWWQRPLAKMKLNQMVGRYKLEGPYNLEAAQLIRAASPKTALLLVGGLRTMEQMQQVVDRGVADLISLCRPLIREPHLVKKFKEGNTTHSSCCSCNKCFVLVVRSQPLRCLCSSGGGHRFANS